MNTLLGLGEVVTKGDKQTKQPQESDIVTPEIDNLDTDTDEDGANIVVKMSYNE